MISLKAQVTGQYENIDDWILQKYKKILKILVVGFYKNLKKNIEGIEQKFKINIDGMKKIFFFGMLRSLMCLKILNSIFIKFHILKKIL